MQFKKIIKTVKVNQVDVEVEVIVNVHDESDDLGAFLDTYDDGGRKRIEAFIEAGKLFPGSIVVEARALGLTGYDSLGACELTPNNMFDSKPFDKSVEHYLKEYGMEVNAVTELVKQLETEHNRLTENAKQYKAFAK